MSDEKENPISPGLFVRLTGWIVRRPWMGLMFIAVVSALALTGYMAPEVVTDFVKSLTKGSETADEQEGEQADVADANVAQDYRRVQEFDFRGESVVLVQSEQFFTPDGAECIRTVVEELRAQPHIARVTWMNEIPPMNAFGLPEPLLPKGVASKARFEIARQKALNHPFIAGQLMSEDANALILTVNFNRIFLKEDRDCIEGLRDLAEQSAAAFPDVEMTFSVTGRLPIWLTAVKSHDQNQLVYQIIAYCMIALMSIVLFRGITSVFVVALAPALGVFWTMGFIRYFGFEMNPFNDVVLPVLVSLVGFTDGVHLMVHIRRNRVSGMTPRKAAEFGIEQVGLACFLTSFTTAIGFGSLWLASNNLVQEFGACCVIGVMCSFFAVVTTIPLACSTWLGRRIHIGHDKSLIDKNLNKIGRIIDFVLQRKKVMAIVALIVTATLFSISMTLEPDEKQSYALPAGSEASTTLAEIDRVMGGLERSQVDVSWNPNVPSDDPEVMTVIGKVDNLLETEELLGRPLSLYKIVAAFPGDGQVTERMSMVDLLPASIKRAFYRPEEKSAEVQFRVQDLGIAAYGPVFERVEAGFKGIVAEHPDFELSLSGRAVNRWRNLYQIVVDLATSLGTASLIIFIVLAFVYRSLRIGLISIVPNIFPLTVAGTYLVITGQNLEIVTVCAFTVCLGIAVDDTIHFLTRYYEERKLGGSDAEVIRRSFIGVGTALIITTIVLVSGFLTVFLSDSRDHQIFAAMGAITISAALFGDLVFLPAMLAKFAKGKDNS